MYMLWKETHSIVRMNPVGSPLIGGIDWDKVVEGLAEGYATSKARIVMRC